MVFSGVSDPSRQSLRNSHTEHIAPRERPSCRTFRPTLLPWPGWRLIAAASISPVLVLVDSQHAIAAPYAPPDATSHWWQIRRVVSSTAAENSILSTSVMRWYSWHLHTPPSTE